MSAAVKIASITVNGRDTLYGGKIFYFDMTNNFDSPVKIQINVINKEGTYNEPTLDLSSSEKIEISGIKLNMFLYKYKKRVSSQGSILELYYMDGSFKLDKVYIGLFGKHGWSKYYNQLWGGMYKYTFTEIIEKNLKEQITKDLDTETQKFDVTNKDFWLMGRLMHPCDENKDNVVTFDEQTHFDRCDPCPSCPEEKYENRCFELLYSATMEFQYPFRDFLDAFEKAEMRISGETLKIESPSSNLSSLFEKYYKDYFGSLREVLTAWCNDFGLNWYFDPTDTTIKFIDLSSQQIKVNKDSIVSQYKGTKLISYEDGTDNSTSFDSKVISWYQKPGEKKSYECSKMQYELLHPLYGIDFIGNRQRTPWYGGEEIDGENDVLSAIIQNYSPTLREIYWHRAVYHITGKESAGEYLTSFSSSSSSSIDFEQDAKDIYVLSDKKLIPELGDVKVLGIASSPPLEIKGTESTFQKNIKNDYGNFLSLLNPYEAKRFAQDTGYFIVAYCDEMHLKKRMDLERELYDFIGRWYSTEHFFRLCGITGNDEFVKNNTQIESSDGSATIFSKKDDIGTHPFSKYKYYQYGYLSCLLGTGNRMSEENAKIIDKEKKKRYEQTVVLLNREPKWFPESGPWQEACLDHISETYGDMVWKLMGEPFSDSRTFSPIPQEVWLDWIFDEVPALKTSDLAGNIKVFAVRPGNPFPLSGIRLEGNIPHPKDHKKTMFDARKNTKLRNGGKWSKQILPLGLLDDSCTKITLQEDDENLLKIFTPPHTFAGQPVSRSTVVGNSPCNVESFRKQCYRIAVTQTFNQSIRVPKMLTGLNENFDAVDAKAMKYKLTYNDVLDDDLKFLDSSTSGGPYNRGTYGCTINGEAIKKSHENYKKNIFKNIVPSDSVTITIKGLPDLTDYTQEIKRGLSSFSIQLNDQGSSSTINYDSKQILEISSDIIKHYQFRRADTSRPSPF